MTLLPSGVKIHVALGVTDMRKGLDGLAMLVQGTLKHDPFSGHLFVFRGRKADLLKILFWDGTGLCLFTKRLEQSRWRPVQPHPCRRMPGVEPLGRPGASVRTAFGGRRRPGPVLGTAGPVVG